MHNKAINKCTSRALVSSMMGKPGSREHHVMLTSSVDEWMHKTLPRGRLQKLKRWRRVNAMCKNVCVCFRW